MMNFNLLEYGIIKREDTTVIQLFIEMMVDYVDNNIFYLSAYQLKIYFLIDIYHYALLI